MKKIVAILLVAILLLGFTPSITKAENSSNEVEKTIIGFYDKAYDSWLQVEYQDLTDYLYTDSIQAYNKITTLKECISRWKYSIENGYVDNREKHDIIFNFSELIYNEDNTVTVAVYISGDNTQAYPYFVNFGENIYTLINDNGEWKITAHTYDDIEMYEYSNTEKVEYDESAVIEEIEANNASVEVSVDEGNENLVRAYPYTSYAYSSSRAVAYANQFCKNSNSYFYTASSDCTNFVSQCISYGFGSTTSYTSSTSYRMRNNNNATTGWFAGSGGGSSPWESVNAHWNYMISSKTNDEGPRVTQISYSGLSTGCVMQIDFNSDGSYDHSVICVNGDTEKFAQHTSNCYRYYDDYSGTKRFYRPIAYRVY